VVWLGDEDPVQLFSDHQHSTGDFGSFTEEDAQATTGETTQDSKE
jgi:hypothetical protein